MIIELTFLASVVLFFAYIANSYDEAEKDRISKGIESNK